MSRKLKPSTSVVSILILFVFATMLNLHAVSFVSKTQAGKDGRHHADFNNDGREDFVVPAPGGFQVQLSNGGGTYNAPKFYALPSGNTARDFAIGNFGGGSIDIIAIDGKTGSLFDYGDINNSGTFNCCLVIAQDQVPLAITAGDFNHDGDMDLVYGYLDGAAHHSVLRTLLGPVMSGQFTFGKDTIVADNGEQSGLLLGDFDGDGKADLMAEDCMQLCDVSVYYGDGAGGFPGQVHFQADTLAQLRPFDVNGDGKMDLIGLAWAFPLSGEIFFKYIEYYKGTAARTWTETKISTNRCVNGEGRLDRSDPLKVAVADFNGDGIPDIAFEEVSNCDGSFPHYDVIKTGNSNGSFNAEQVLSQPGVPTSDIEVLRSVRNNKPNLALTVCTSSSCSANDIKSFLNTTAGAFPTCTAPTGFQGIRVCSPAAGSSVSSPVGFHIGAVGQTPMRKVELWIDGHKVAEQFRGAFSNYAFMDKSVALAHGSHKVTIFAAGWDNWLEKSSFTINVN